MKIKQYQKLLLFLLAFLWIAGCSESTEQPIIAASYEDIVITASDFERSYYQWFFITDKPDSPELRRAYARQMIEQELISEAALTSGVISEDEISLAARRDEALFLRRRYLEKTLKDTIAPISDEQLNQAIARQKRQLYVRQVYARDEAGIRQLEERINTGESLESVARATLPDENMAKQDGAMGWVGWNDTDLPVENVLYKLEKGEISPPIQSLVGWHIFRVDSVRVTYEFHQQDPTYHRRDTRHQMINQRLDIAAAAHLRELVWQTDLAVDGRLFKPVWNYISPLLPKGRGVERLSNPDVVEQQLSPDLAQQTLAWVDGEPFTVQEFLDAIPMLPRDLLGPNLKKAVEVAVRDRLVTGAAIESGLAEDPVVQEKSRRSRITLGYYATIAAMENEPEHRVNLRDFYEENKDRYVASRESEIEEILLADADEALKLARQISEGADFATMANKHSLRKNVQDGYLGFKAESSGPLGKRAAKLRPGQIFAPVKSAEGYSVIRVRNQKLTHRPFEEVKNRIGYDAQRVYYEDLHEDLLPPSYQPEKIVYNDEGLNRAFTNASTTVF